MSNLTIEAKRKRILDIRAEHAAHKDEPGIITVLAAKHGVSRQRVHQIVGTGTRAAQVARRAEEIRMNVAKGLTTKETAAALGISINSVQAYRRIEGIAVRPSGRPRTVPFTHGTTGGYSNWKCRCAPCTNAWRLYQRKRRTMKRVIYIPRLRFILRQLTPALGCEGHAAFHSTCIRCSYYEEARELLREETPR